MKLVKIGSHYINPMNITHFMKHRIIGSPDTIEKLVIHFTSGDEPLHVNYTGDEKDFAKVLEDALNANK